MEPLQHTSHLAICFIYKPLSLVTESSESMDFMRRHPILYFNQVIKSIMYFFQIFLPLAPGQ